MQSEKVDKKIYAVNIDALLWKFDNACRGMITHLIMNFIKTFGDEEER